MFGGVVRGEISFSDKGSIFDSDEELFPGAIAKSIEGQILLQSFYGNDRENSFFKLKPFSALLRSRAANNTIAAS